MYLTIDPSLFTDFDTPHSYWNPDVKTLKLTDQTTVSMVKKLIPNDEKLPDYIKGLYFDATPVEVVQEIIKRMPDNQVFCFSLQRLNDNATKSIVAGCIKYQGNIPLRLVIDNLKNNAIKILISGLTRNYYTPPIWLALGLVDREASHYILNTIFAHGLSSITVEKLLVASSCTSETINIINKKLSSSINFNKFITSSPQFTIICGEGVLEEDVIELKKNFAKFVSLRNNATQSAPPMVEQKIDHDSRISTISAETKLPPTTPMSLTTHHLSNNSSNKPPVVDLKLLELLNLDSEELEPKMVKFFAKISRDVGVRIFINEFDEEAIGVFTSLLEKCQNPITLAIGRMPVIGDEFFKLLCFLFDRNLKANIKELQILPECHPVHSNQIYTYFAAAVNEYKFNKFRIVKMEWVEQNLTNKIMQTSELSSNNVLNNKAGSNCTNMPQEPNSLFTTVMKATGLSLAKNTSEQPEQKRRRPRKKTTKELSEIEKRRNQIATELKTAQTLTFRLGMAASSNFLMLGELENSTQQKWQDVRGVLNKPEIQELIILSYTTQNTISTLMEQKLPDNITSIQFHATTSEAIKQMMAWIDNSQVRRLELKALDNLAINEVLSGFNLFKNKRNMRIALGISTPSHIDPFMQILLSNTCPIVIKEIEITHFCKETTIARIYQHIETAINNGSYLFTANSFSIFCSEEVSPEWIKKFKDLKLLKETEKEHGNKTLTTGSTSHSASSLLSCSSSSSNYNDITQSLVTSSSLLPTGLNINSNRSNGHKRKRNSNSASTQNTHTSSTPPALVSTITTYSGRSSPNENILLRHSYPSTLFSPSNNMLPPLIPQPQKPLLCNFKPSSSSTTISLSSNASSSAFLPYKGTKPK